MGRRFEERWVVPVRLARIGAVWQPLPLFHCTACGTELDFSSDTATPAERVRARHGALLPAPLRLNFTFRVCAERFVAVISDSFSCLLALGGSKGQSPGRPTGGQDLSVLLCQG